MEDGGNFTDNAGVKIPPPLIFLCLLSIGLWYDSLWFNGDLAPVGATVVGGFLVVLGFALIMTSASRHKSIGSSVEPWKPTTSIITTGVYGYSRNPIYLGMAISHLGLAIAGASVGAIVTLAIAILVMQTYVIAREERYLEKKFGNSYTEYKSSVRRWI